MNFSRRIIFLVAAAFIGGTGSYAAGHTAPDALRTITQTRCRSGAVIYRAPRDVRPQPEQASSDHLASVESPESAQGFARPVVSVTFDGGWRGIHDHALPVMKQFGILSTQYLITGDLDNSHDFMTPADVFDLASAGHEIASLSVTHPDLTALGDPELQFELTRSRADLETCFGDPVTDFATPLGDTNPAVTEQIARHYQSVRSSDTGFNTPANFDPHSLLAQFVTHDTSPDQISAWVSTASSSHTWLILVYQRVDDSTDASARPPAQFAQDMKAISSSGIPTLTVHRALEELAPQASLSD